MLQPQQPAAFGGKNVNIAETCAVYLIVLVTVLLGEGDVDVAADVLNVEGSEAGRQRVVVKEFFHFRDMMESRVIDLYASLAEIGDIKKALRPEEWNVDRRHRHTLEDRLALLD